MMIIITIDIQKLTWQKYYLLLGNEGLISIQVSFFFNIISFHFFKFYLRISSEGVSSCPYFVR